MKPYIIDNTPFTLEDIKQKTERRFEKEEDYPHAPVPLDEDGTINERYYYARFCEVFVQNPKNKTVYHARLKKLGPPTPLPHHVQ